VRWTREKPSRPGFYWYRGHGRTRPPIAVEVSDGAVWLCGHEVERHVEEMSGEWFGPLEPPP
jgi:hypothetical protein